MAKHPDPKHLDRFRRASLDRPEIREVVRHLLTGCPTCTETQATLLPFARPSARAVAEPPGFGPMLERVRTRLGERAAKLQLERQEAPQLAAELASLPAERRQVLIRNSRRFQTWGLAEWLLEAPGPRAAGEMDQAIGHGRLALRVVETLDEAVYGPRLVRDLEARAWARLGKALRQGGDLGGAEEALLKARGLLDEGTGDPLEKAEVLALMSTLRADQRRFSEALRLSRRALVIYRRAGEGHRVGCCLIHQGLYRGQCGDPEQAIDLLRQGLAQIEPEAEPRLVLTARHHLVLNLVDAGRHREASDQLAQSRPLYDQLGDPVDRLRRSWLEARIAQGLADDRRAERLLRQAGEGFLGRGMVYDAALVGLDLAALLARQGRVAEMRQLAVEMVPIFQSRELHREAFAALAVFRNAVEMERATLGLIQRLSDFLRTSRNPVGGRFRGDPWSV